MPELPEVRTVIKDLNPKVKNKTISDVLIFLPKLLKNASANEFKKTIIGKKIISVTNKGKFIVFKFSNHTYVVSHLRMEGKYHTKKWQDSTHDYVSFLFKDGTKLIYNDSRQFGTFHLFRESPYDHPPLNKLAKEPGDLNLDFLFSRLQKKRIAIKTALLDQTLILGLGNIYVNEVLWEAKVNPLKSCNAISKSKLNDLVAISKKIMDKSTKLGGSSINSYTSLDMKQGNYQNFLKVHTKQNRPCLRCGNLIKKIKVNGRGTYYCPHCQK